MESAACAEGEWTPPRSVHGADIGAVFAHFPQLAVGPGATYVVGNDVPAFDGRPVRESPLTALVVGGRPIGRPEGRFNLVYPKAAVDERGRLHLLWAEPGTGFEAIRSDRWPPRRLSKIWTAYYQPGTGWSAARILYDGDRLAWDPVPMADGSGVASGAGRRVWADDRLGFVVATFTGEPDRPLLWIRLRGGRFELDTIPTTVRAGKVYPNFVRKGDGVYLAFLSADSDAGAGTNSVFFQRSTDGGKSWSKSVVVAASGGRPASDVRVLLGADDAVHLVWLQVAEHRHRLLRHSVSRDGGASWTAPEDVGTPAARYNLQAAIDGCGTLRAVWENVADGMSEPVLEHAAWAGGWTAPKRLFPGWTTLHPALVTSESGRPLLTFVGYRRNAARKPKLRTLLSISSVR